MTPCLDLTGSQFGFLTVLERAGTCLHGNRLHSTWLCLCACGRAREFRRKQLVEGRKRYCAVRFHEDAARAAYSAASRARWEAIERGPPVNVEHKLTYGSWDSMRQRCGPGGDYERFGITVCDRWAASFLDFLADMGPRPSSAHSIDRIDTFGDYEPGNCRWATTREQSENKRNTRWIEWRGERRKLIAVCRELDADLSRVSVRLALGWSVERALTEPVITRGPYIKRQIVSADAGQR